MNPNRNYHSDLCGMKDPMDAILLQLRKKETDNWRWKAVKGPIKDIMKLVQLAKPLTKVGWGSIALGGVSGAWILGKANMLPYWVIGLALFALVGLFYTYLVHRYTNQMIVLGSPLFHLEAYKKKRKSEYEMFHFLWSKDDFNFQGLYDLVTQSIANREEQGKSIEQLTSFFEGLKNELLREKEELREAYEEKLAQYDQLVEALNEDVERAEEAIEYIVALLRDIVTCLYRLVNGYFHIADLTFICGFTLYERRDEELVKISDMGTTGVSPKTLSLTEHYSREYAAVTVARNNLKEPRYDNPYPGRSIVSYLLEMAHGRQWVWNFHFNDVDKKSLSLLLSNDIIETKEIYRLIHVFCLILQQRGFPGEEAGSDERQIGN